MNCRQYPPGRRIRGFTLVELMVAVAVAIVLAVLALPSFAGLIERSRLRSAADSIQAALAQARAEAVKNDRPVAVKLAGTAANWCIGGASAANHAVLAPMGTVTACECDSSPGTCNVNGRQLLRMGSEFSGVTVDDATVDTEIVFDNKQGTISGLAPPDPLILVSSSGDYTVGVAVSALGHTRLCKVTGVTSLPGIDETCP